MFEMLSFFQVCLFLEIFVRLILPKVIVLYGIQTSLHRTSAGFLYEAKLGEGSHSAGANAAKFITDADGAVSKRPVEKSLSTQKCKRENKCIVTKRQQRPRRSNASGLLSDVYVFLF